jgi:hypothetical protein
VINRFVLEGTQNGLRQLNFSTGWACTNNEIIEYVKNVLPWLTTRYIETPIYNQLYKMKSSLPFTSESNLKDRVMETARWFVTDGQRRQATRSPSVLSTI